MSQDTSDVLPLCSEVCIPTHTFQRISVDLTGDQILTRFRDQNGDDPFEWFVEYSVLR